MWAQALSDDGLDLRGDARALVTLDASWEGTIVEGPSMFAHGGKHFLFYSGNWYDSDRYAIGYATCDGPLGPCVKATTKAPLFASTGGALGPGGQEIFTDARGATWLAYHAWTSPRASYAAGGARSLRLSPIDLASGVPALR